MRFQPNLDNKNTEICTIFNLNYFWNFIYWNNLKIYTEAIIFLALLNTKFYDFVSLSIKIFVIYN